MVSKGLKSLSMTSVAVFTLIVGNSGVGAAEVSPQNCPANRGVFVRMPLKGRCRAFELR